MSRGMAEAEATIKPTTNVKIIVASFAMPDLAA